MRIAPDKAREIIERRLTETGRNGHDIDYDCPFCEREGSHGTLHVNYNKGDGCAICHQCWYATRNSFVLIRDVFGYVPKRIMRLLDRPQLTVDVESILSIPFRRNASNTPDPVVLPESFKRVGPKHKGIGRAIYRYLRRTRGMRDEEMELYGVGYFTDPKEKGYGYAIFPFWMDGRVVYWQGRRVIGRGPKSWNPPQTGKISLLYGHEQAAEARTLFVCEGPLDAIAWGPGGLALTSKELHPRQVRALSMFDARRVIVCLDAEEWTRTREYAVRLHHSLTATVGALRLPHGDPDDWKGRLHRLARRRVRWLHGDVEQVRAVFSQTDEERRKVEKMRKRQKNRAWRTDDSVL